MKTGTFGRASGKIILFGEHAVVHGAPGLAAGIERGATASLEVDPRSSRRTLELGGRAVEPSVDGDDLSRAFAELVEPGAPAGKLVVASPTAVTGHSFSAGMPASALLGSAALGTFEPGEDLVIPRAGDGCCAVSRQALAQTFGQRAPLADQLCLVRALRRRVGGVELTRARQERAPKAAAGARRPTIAQPRTDDDGRRTERGLERESLEREVERARTRAAEHEAERPVMQRDVPAVGRRRGRPQALDRVGR